MPMPRLREAGRNNCIPLIVFPTAKQEWLVQLKGDCGGPFFQQQFAVAIAAMEAMRLRRIGRSRELF
jgi:hypothetical protein